MRHKRVVTVALLALLSALAALGVWRLREKRRADAERAALEAQRAEQARLLEELNEAARRAELEGPPLYPGEQRLKRLLPEWGSRATACETDSDCAVTCDVDGRCCGKVCWCENVYSRELVSALAEQRERECNDASCFTASCFEPCFHVSPVCEANRCTSVRTRRPGCNRPDPKLSSSCGCPPGDPLCSCL